MEKSDIRKTEKRIRNLRIVVLISGLLVLIFAALLEFIVSSNNTALIFLELVGSPVWCIAASGVILIVVSEGLLPVRPAFSLAAVLAYSASCLISGKFFLLPFTLDFSMKTAFAVIFLCFYVPPLLFSLWVFVTTALQQDRPESIVPKSFKRNKFLTVAGIALSFAGLLLTCQAAVRFYKPINLDSWKRCTLPETTVSMLLPEKQEELNRDGVTGIFANTGKMIILFCKWPDAENANEKEETNIKERIISGPVYETVDGVEYEEYVSKITQDKLTGYSTVKKFSLDGEDYSITIMVFGHLDLTVKKDIPKILDTLSLRSD